MRWSLALKVSSFTPITKVASTLVAGAEMTTLDAPASRWAAAFSPSVKMPVDSTTTSTPRSDQGRALGSRSAKKRTVWPATLIPSPTTSTSSPSLPWVESNRRRWAKVSGDPRSFTATTSMSALALSMAR